MQYFGTTDALATHKTDCIAVAVFEQGQLSASAQAINELSNDRISRIVDRGDISGKAGQTAMLHDLEGIKSTRILLVGCGKQDKVTENNFNSAITAMAKVLNESGVSSASSCLAEINVSDKSSTWNVRQSVITTETALYKYSLAKSDNKPQEKPLEELGFFTDNNIDEVELAAKTGQAIANGMNLARELGNFPGNICTPTYLANQAVEIGDRFDTVETTILDEAEMEELGMGSLLSVSRGSRQPAKLITMNYKGAGDENQ